MTDLRELPVFSADPWQMSYGERVALEGLLRVLRPQLSIEIGRAEGGSLGRLAAHSARVISFDLVEPYEQVSSLANVTFHTGDSHRQLPEQLAELAASGQNVDFVLVDGDHSAAGVRQDMLDLLESSALGETVIVAHDSLNELVRAGLEAVPYESYEKVSWVDLDFLPGGVARVPAYDGQCWGGFAFVVLGPVRWVEHGSPRNQTWYPAADVAWPWARARRGQPPIAQPGENGSAGVREIARLRADLEHTRAELERQVEAIESVRHSKSWRMTAPLRAAAARRRGR